MKKKTIEDIEVQNQRILVRVDYNVPLKNGQITDDWRIRASLDTIRYLLERQAVVILISHLGRPKGQRKKELSLKPAAERLGQLLGMEVPFIEDCIGEPVRQAAGERKPGELIMLENLRFHKEEEENEPGFAEALSALADFYVDDAFAACHREHASITGISKYRPSVAGLLVSREMDVLQNTLQSPQKPFVCVLGGAKVADKIPVITSLLDKADVLCIGGAMAYTFLKAQEASVGSSKVEKDSLEQAADILKKAKDSDVRLHLPQDHVVTEDLENPKEATTTDGRDVPENKTGADIGPKTRDRYREEIMKARTVIWNGPMGIFEKDAFAEGTKAVAHAMAEARAKTIVGGGDTGLAVKTLGLMKQYSHISTGGGAFLEFISGKELPGIRVLEDKI